MSRTSGLLLAVVLAFLAGCEEPPPRAVGQLVSDRLELTAETAEPITLIAVTEGDRPRAGDVLLEQDSRRIDARIAEAAANISRIEAQLAEQLNGPRREAIDASRAQVREREAELQFHAREADRLTALLARNLASQESLDLAVKSREVASAALASSVARLAELESGTRPEQIDQTKASLQSAQALLVQLQIDRDRLSVRAPVDALVDFLPFEVGERPAVGQVVAVLLAGQQPLARVYVPEPLRLGVKAGDPVRVRVDGVDEVLSGTVRRIESDASFTPYFALTESDRGRLSFVAEITIPDRAARLPEGMPVEVFFAGTPVPNDE